MHSEKISACISLVIPVYNDLDNVRQLLTAMTTMPHIAEIIVVEGGNQNACERAMKQFSKVHFLQSNKSRGLQIDTGIRRAKGEYIWVLHADSHVCVTSTKEICAILKDQKVALGCFYVKFDATHPLLKFFSYVSRFDSPLTTFGDQGYFFRRTDYLKCGGVAEFPLLEDVAMRSLLLKSCKGKVVKSKQAIGTSADSFVKNGVLKTQLYNGWILLRFFFGVSANQLYREYYDE